MRAASRVLQYTTLSAPVLEDGQESIKKLALAPFGFLSLGGNTSYIASILASAVTFLEGCSAEDLETDVRLLQDVDGEYAVHTELKLVPYSFPRQSSFSIKGHETAAHALTSVSLPKVTCHFSVSQTLLAPLKDASPTFELDRFKKSFQSNGMLADVVANDILLTTDSVDVVNAVLRYSAEVGLTISRSTLAELMSRMKPRESSLPHAILKEIELETNVGIARETSLFLSHPSAARLSSARRRKQSKLERLRSSPSCNSYL